MVTLRNVIAALVALALLFVAATLATTLQTYRRRRQRARDSERALGRTIIAELPTSEDLVLFTEDQSRFHYGEQSIDKERAPSTVLEFRRVAVRRFDLVPAVR